MFMLHPRGGQVAAIARYQFVWIDSLLLVILTVYYANYHVPLFPK